MRIFTHTGGGLEQERDTEITTSGPQGRYQQDARQLFDRYGSETAINVRLQPDNQSGGENRNTLCQKGYCADGNGDEQTLQTPLVAFPEIIKG